MKALYAVLLALVLGVGCGNKEPQDESKKKIPKPEGEYFIENGDGEEIFDFRPGGNLRWEWKWKRPRARDDNPFQRDYDWVHVCKWHMDGDLVITEVVERSKYSGQFPYIFREEKGALYIVGFTADKNWDKYSKGDQQLDPPGSAESIRLRKR